MNNYIFLKIIDGVNGEVLVMIVVVAMAAIFKSGGLKFIQDIWTTMTSTASEMFS